MPKPEHEFITVEIEGQPQQIPFAQTDRLRDMSELVHNLRLGLRKCNKDPGQIELYLYGSLMSQHKNAAEFFYRQIEPLDAMVPKDLLLQMFYDYAVRSILREL